MSTQGYVPTALSPRSWAANAALLLLGTLLTGMADGLVAGVMAFSGLELEKLAHVHDPDFRVSRWSIYSGGFTTGTCGGTLVGLATGFLIYAASFGRDRAREFKFFWGLWKSLVGVGGLVGLVLGVVLGSATLVCQLALGANLSVAAHHGHVAGLVGVFVGTGLGGLAGGILRMKQLAGD